MINNSEFYVECSLLLFLLVLAALGLHCCVGSPLAVEGRGHFLVVMRRPLIAAAPQWASLVAGHWLLTQGLQWLQQGLHGF